jgi:electron transfer flavoprotein beta subunit
MVFEDTPKKKTINPYDVYTLQEAKKLKDERTEIICLLMGKNDDRIATELKFLGVDRVIFASDPIFAGADTVATTYVLWKAILKIGEVDMIFCGDHAVDGETGHVAPGLAQRMNFAYLGNVDECFRLDDIYCIVNENGYKLTYLVRRGSLLSFANCITRDVKLPLLMLRRVHATEYDNWSRGSLGLKKEECGLSGSKTRVIRTRPVHADHIRACEETDAGKAKLFLQGGYQRELSVR